MGIFVTKGMGLRVPPGGLVIGSEASTLTLHVSLDVWPYWLSLATRHARDAELARSALIAAGEDAAARQTALEAEFSAGMQAAVCAAVAVDAFFAVVKCAYRPSRSPVSAHRDHAFRGIAITRTGASRSERSDVSLGVWSDRFGVLGLSGRAG